MRVLDLDLDFFLSDCCPLAAPGARPDEGCAAAWEAERVDAFLQAHCGLHKERPLPGRIFDTHDQALDFWQQMMESGRLSAPFTVVHVDAHADLAIGPPGPDFVLKAVLTKDVSSRPALASYRSGKKLDEANYLLFALGFRWIDDLTLVRIERSKPDIPPVLRSGENALRLASDIARLMEAKHGREPSVPLHVVDDWRAYRGGAFDFITLARSPRYAPRSADALVPVIQAYIDPQ